ncbi:MAG: 16S rRNA (guanine(966)-N(2))-methyltransferase RsmD [Deltaproteobacteria bacterium]|nr:MAG: 16S rRNA (guanine(966)-N(2))-methyltransferase RsmD [Desulfobacteraceae bacterium 4484_190.3]RLB19397.1 MAG: 16S rRNA (guanine(966)-N(2))-methyltransferase RsmD [Deltaproteobacteria bacterium]
MRITGGKLKGRHLVALKGLSIRPTSDRVRQAIFNVIGQHWEGKRVLDLFAGTGSLGLEALSRGASEALFVDASPYALKLLKKNIERCGVAHCSRVIRRDLQKGPPEKQSAGERSFQLLFMDPPYGKNLIPKVMGRLGETSLLSPGSLLVAECSKNENLPSRTGRFAMHDVRIYGDTKITIYICEVVE